MTTHTIEDVALRILPDEDADTSYLEQPEFSDRAEMFANREFHYIGIDAAAEVYIAGVRHVLTSGGLWGIESDSGDEYLAEVAHEQWDELRAVLLAANFTQAQVDQMTPRSFDPHERI